MMVSNCTCTVPVVNIPSLVSMFSICRGLRNTSSSILYHLHKIKFDLGIFSCTFSRKLRYNSTAFLWPALNASCSKLSRDLSVQHNNPNSHFFFVFLFHIMYRIQFFLFTAISVSLVKT